MYNEQYEIRMDLDRPEDLLDHEPEDESEQRVVLGKKTSKMRKKGAEKKK